jgi:microcystin-dependent protein
LEKGRLTVEEMPSHTHAINSYTATGGTIFSLLDHENALNNGWKTTAIKPTGGGNVHNNMQPYRAAYIFKRTA